MVGLLSSTTTSPRDSALVQEPPNEATREQGRDPRSRPPAPLPLGTAKPPVRPEPHLAGKRRRLPGSAPDARAASAEPAPVVAAAIPRRHVGFPEPGLHWQADGPRLQPRAVPGPGHPLPSQPPRWAGTRAAHAAGPPSCGSSVARLRSAVPHLPGRGVWETPWRSPPFGHCPGPAGR